MLLWNRQCRTGLDKQSLDSHIRRDGNPENTRTHTRDTSVVWKPHTLFCGDVEKISHSSWIMSPTTSVTRGWVHVWGTWKERERTKRQDGAEREMSHSSTVERSQVCLWRMIHFYIYCKTTSAAGTNKANWWWNLALSYKLAMKLHWLALSYTLALSNTEW